MHPDAFTADAVPRRTGGSTHGPPALRTLASLTMALGVLATIHACGGEDTPVAPPPPEPSVPTTITLDPDTFFVTAGATVRLRSMVEDQHGKLIFSAPRTWVSSDPSVATVDTAGVVTGIREGRATVTVTSGQVSATAAGTIHSHDRPTLMDLLRLAGGDSWTNRLNWGSNEPLASWYGVEVNADARVTALRLSGNGLSGNLPEDLGDMVFLAELELDGNEGLTGPIPFSLSELKLQQLQYGGTMLCTVRDEGFRAWLNAIPDRDGDFIACIEERSDLMKLYDAMGGENWVNSRNWGTGLPLETWHGIDVDSATGRVTEINLNRNDLSGEIPTEIQYFPQLRLLRLDHNELFGEVPSEIGLLTELRRMDIDGNNFTGRIPPEIGNLVKLRELWMGSNEMSGPIPPEIGNLADLRELHIYEVRFDGPIPEEFGQLTELRRLAIWDTRMDGPIPASLGALRKLRFLYLNDNAFSGPLPAELGDMDSLERLDLNDNLITGPLPTELGQLENLEYLIVGDNMIDGPLPPEFGALDELTRLHLQNNPDMSGPLPPELTSLENLQELVAHETGLCAPADPEIRTWLNDVVTKWRVRSCEAEAHAGAYLIQSTQSVEYPVPLVAGRSALLRVFVVSDQETTENIPPVRATFFVNGTEVHAVDIPAGASPIPTELQVGVISLSANALIPAEVIQPGLEMVVEVDPNKTVDAALGVAKRIPAEGRAAVEVREVPPLILTLIPFISRADDNRDAVMTVDTATVDSDLFFETRTLLPVGAFKIVKHSSVRIDSNSIFDMLGEVERIRAIEQGTGHWMGLNANAAGARGVAYLGNNPRPGRSKVSMSRLIAETIAHELGHNLNLRHTDCGNPANVDLTFPYGNARTGVWGYDPRDGGSLVPPSRADFMSYCDPTWVSDYYFTNALRFRLADTTEVQTDADVRTLLVSGGAAADGTLHIDPAFVVETWPMEPLFGGPYLLTGRRADESELFSLSFNMQPIMDGDGRFGFTFALPVQDEWEAELASLVLTGPEDSVELRAGSGPAMAIMRDPVSGEVRAILRDLPADAMTPGALDALAPEPGLEIMVSDGLPRPVAWRR